MKQRLSSQWYIRIPAKWLVFGLVTFVVLFPYPRQFARHLSHVRNLEAMVQPEAPELVGLEREFRSIIQTPDGSAPDSPRAMQKAVERFILDKIKYRWDWDLWGSADYMPTVSEMFTLASQHPARQLYEDCDGRAVMAASLMRRLGYKSRIVTDLRHVWVTTPQGEYMGPGGPKMMRSTDKGNEFRLLAAIQNIPRALSYGVAVFPWWRECIIMTTAFLLMLSRRMSPRTIAFAGLLLIQGWLFIRCGVIVDLNRGALDTPWPGVVGLIHVAAAVAILLRAARRVRRSPRMATPGLSPAHAGIPKAQG